MSDPRQRGPAARRTARRVVGALLVLTSLAACSVGALATAPITTSPVSPEPPSAAASGGTDAGVTCGGRTFPASGLDAPTGAEKLSGPEFDALRATLGKLRSAFPGSSDWTWLLAGRDASGAIFLTRTDVLGWVAVEVRANANGWQPGNMGQCHLRRVLSADFGPATWALDPAFPSPGPQSAELHILVWEEACSGGSPTTGRMSAPVIEYTPQTVTITIGVRSLAGAQTCPLPPGTPALVRLTEPLGNRALLDGGHVPPAPPSPANG